MSVVTMVSGKLSRKQRSMLNLAVRSAESSELRHKHGAVVVKSGRVLSIGQNKQRNISIQSSMPMERDHFTVHAEADALSRVADARGATIYVARLNKVGEERMSQPCGHCEQLIRKAGVKTVVYTTHD